MTDVIACIQSIEQVRHHVLSQLFNRHDWSCSYIFTFKFATDPD